MRRYLFVYVMLLGSAIVMQAQELLISDQSVNERRTTISELPSDGEKSVAEAYARQHNLPIRMLRSDGTVWEIKKLSPTGMPLYNRTMNLNSARTSSSDLVWEGGGAGLDLSGAGVVVGIWDEARVRITHDEFGGRARILDNSSEISDHATHVAGTVGAAGLMEGAHGMAHKSRLDSYDWNNDDNEIRSAAENGLLLSNHSYGIAQGFEYDQGESRWEWWGDASISETEDYNFGFYGTDARSWDQIAYDNPNYLLVKSAGNDRGDGPAPGGTHYVWSNGAWIASNKVRDLDGGSDGYECLGTRSTAKNIMVVGAVQDIPGGFQKPSDVVLASFSGFGPTDDGRIKPDIVGNGIGLYSTTSGSDQSYGSKSGTSMSSPSVTGSMALLQQQFRELHGYYMSASQLKAVVLHTADDAGNVGPDYQMGWGLMNTASAAAAISSVPADRFFYDTLQNNEKQEFTFFSRGTEPVKISIVWADPAGEASGPQLNPTGSKLVNDLDIRLKRQVDGALFRPWVLDPAKPSRSATKGDNDLDNVEQILIEEPMTGFYTLEIAHKVSLRGGEQTYALIVSGLDTDFIASGYNELSDANGAILLTSADYYISNMDVQWLIRPDNGLPVSFYFDFLETASDQDVLSIYDGDDDTAPLLAQFSGLLSANDTIINSTGNMFLTFTSDAGSTSRGFQARYCTVAPEGEYDIVGEKHPCFLSGSAYFATGQAGASFSWNHDQGWSFQEKTANGIDLDIGEEQGYLSVIPENRCGTGSSSQLYIDPLQGPPVLIAVGGDTVPCSGVTGSIYTDALPGSSYQWELPANWNGTSETDTIFFRAETSGYVKVTALNACGKGSEINTFIKVVDAPGQLNIITELVPPCAMTSQQFHVNNTEDYTYLWEVRDDWQILGGANSDTVQVLVGNSQNFLFLNSSNKCGESTSNRLFLTAPAPDKPNLATLDMLDAYPRLQVTNENAFAYVQWYRNGQTIPGEQGKSNPFVVNLNGVYSVASVSDKGCMTLLDEADGINVEIGSLAYRAYRTSSSTIVISNTTTVNTDFQIISMSGTVMFTGELIPGDNEFIFPYTGVFLIRMDRDDMDRNLKSFF